MTNKLYEELDRFEQGMVDHLVGRFRYAHDDAVRLYNDYAPVLEHLQKHYSCEDYAVWIHQAKVNGLLPEQWIDRIRSLDHPAQGAGR
ncbi:hypothetical protein MO973_26475 [Paenibacillus sp. TRM 82003]|nr:hypothetical protein [Paenibacillus sp. TRM 82003]